MFFGLGVQYRPKHLNQIIQKERKRKKTVATNSSNENKTYWPANQRNLTERIKTKK
jgi:hypothetical protein